MENVIIIAALLWSLYLIQRFRPRRKRLGAIQKAVVVTNRQALRLASSLLQNHQ